MVRRRIKLYSYHTFLVVPFIVLFLFAHNPGQADLSMSYRTLLLGMALTVLLFGIVYLVLRDRLKTGVYVTILLFTLFQYGVVYEFFERKYYAGEWPLANIHRYLLLTYALFLGGLLWFIRRSPREFIRVNYFLNILLAVLIGYNSVLLATTRLRDADNRDTVPSERTQSDKVNSSDPSIYFIILDGYASGRVLKKYYGFDNSSFYRALGKLGFNIADSAIANYYYTSHSLSATLNMEYLTSTEKAGPRIKDNRLFRMLKDRGYRIYDIYSGYAVSSSFQLVDSTVTIAGPNEFEKSLLKHTILRLDDLLGIFAHRRLVSQFEKMHTLVGNGDRPRFVFIHIVAPHPPYVFHRNGRIRTRHRYAEHSWEPREYYVDQLVYVNTQVESLLSHIRTADPRSFIFLESDHGPWITSSDPAEVFDARSHILYAWYAPTPLQIPEVTSPVNTFRWMWSGVFGKTMPPLADELAGKEALFKDPIFLKKVSKASARTAQ